jgi:type II secretory pathway pseudopilin PulG
MYRGKGKFKACVGGYTIIETLIFLAVSAAMFIAAMAFVSGQQNRAEFVNAVRNFEQQLIDVGNDVATGYYSYPSGLTCNADGSNNPQVGATGPNRCILLGMVLKFGEGGTLNQYSKVTMVGSRVNSANVDVHNLAETHPVPIETSVNTQRLFGARVECVYKNSGGCGTNNAAVGFFTKLAGSVTEDTGKNNIIRTDLLIYPSVTFSDTISATYSKISATTVGVDYSTGGLASPANLNPQSLALCLVSDTTNQHAMVTIRGALSGSLTITSVISGGTACP